MKNLTFKEIKAWVGTYNENTNHIKLLVDKGDPRVGGIVLGIFTCPNEQALKDFEMVQAKNHYGWNKTDNMTTKSFYIENKQFETIYHIINWVELGMSTVKEKQNHIEKNNDLDFGL